MTPLEKSERLAWLAAKAYPDEHYNVGHAAQSLQRNLPLRELLEVAEAAKDYIEYLDSDRLKTIGGKLHRETIRLKLSTLAAHPAMKGMTDGH